MLIGHLLWGSPCVFFFLILNLFYPDDNPVGSHITLLDKQTGKQSSWNFLKVTQLGRVEL